ncbi:GNAT family N-acetyltransferase [Shewanella gelidii]|uniref:GNAT family N-acetyltransferase n=1 Tax=Shewanella gelidii TaxID=1642821 RepID=A0A917N826_9GAMM|nr:peptidogalycan biosysnthesis protein [Shewanella gelidii]MCL1099220.1 GNAT family N-acetyltransferase [Shewanella gelidii]GGI76572.1 hypothetical protein GCM10009332_12380 [Shewanella gelidii]
MLESLTLETLDSIGKIDAKIWDDLMASLGNPDSDSISLNGHPEGLNPFNRHHFLHALEQSGCVSAKTGWRPMHIVLKSNQHIVAVMPLYLKSHSYGEYVFDWAWAKAYERHQIEYYPKLLSSIPFTPVAGNRIGIATWLAKGEIDQVYQLLRTQLDQLMLQLDLSSWHCLFLPQNQWRQLMGQHADGKPQSVMTLSSKGAIAACADPESPAYGLARHGVQFHWQNKGYRCFEDFLATLTSRKRKNIRKERAVFAPRASSQTPQSMKFEFEFVEGTRLSKAQIQEFYHCYQVTYLKRSGHHGYLNLAFFEHLVMSMPEQVLMLRVLDRQRVASSEGKEQLKPQLFGPTSQSVPPEDLSDDNVEPQSRLVASSLFFKSQTHLYGRYWGALEEVEGLHFEACYYQGIDYCIANGLQVFDAGAQGEHKLARGFEPVQTYSNHQIAHPEFYQAIAEYTAQERRNMKVYLQQSQAALPFKKGDNVDG